MDEGARNVTPDKLPAKEFAQLAKSCDLHLAEMLAVLQPDFLVGIGQFAEACLARVATAAGLELVPAVGATPSFPTVGILRILHPSPASPAANRDWAGVVEKTLLSSGVWQKKG
jgi:single-strand selective monofunctional uracil DNA glycosylase